MDIVGHVNNVKYMEWCIDAAMPEGVMDRAIGEFEINFIHEALLGNHVLIKGVEFAPVPEAGVSDEDVSFKLHATREEDGQEVMRAKIIWAGN